MSFFKRLTLLSLVVLSELAIALLSTQAAQARLAITPVDAVTQQHTQPPEQLLNIESGIEVALRFRTRQRSSWRRWGAPRWSIGGAARGGCTLNEAPLVPLMPVTNLVDNYPTFSAVTVEEHPTFFAYVPQTTARSVEFLLIDEESGDVVYEPPALAIDGSAQIVSFRHDASLPPLQLNKTYTWYFTIICGDDSYSRPDIDDNSGNPYVRGWVQRVELDPSLTTALAATPLRDRPDLYAEAGIWLDTLTALAQLRCTSPNDASVAQDWSDLMQALDLYQIPDLSMRVERDVLTATRLSQCSALN